MSQSAKLFEVARRLMPGGVNSPVRAFRSVGGTPRFIDRAAGPRVTDVDGNTYIDYVGSWGPLIAGHAHPKVVEAIQEAAARGTSYGAPTVGENRLAELVIDRMPSVERVRFVTSGTEAAMSAVRLARAATGREMIVKFDGCYHGHADSMLVSAGSGVLTLGQPDSPGVPEAVARTTLSIPFNSTSAIDEVFAAHGSEIAAVILEPVAGNMGVIEAEAGYLQYLRDVTSKHGALLIFDEVITGFRVSRGGAQERYGITPDLTVMGKVVGGGLPVGGLLDAARAAGLPATANRVGSMMTLFFTGETVRDYESAKTSDTARYGQYFNALLDRGVYVAPSQFECGFVSLAHTDDVIDETLAAAGDALQSIASAS